MSERKLAYATVEIEVSFWEEDDPPLTQSEVEDLAHDRSLWADWRVLRVSQKRRAPVSMRGHAYRGTEDRSSAATASPRCDTSTALARRSAEEVSAVDDEAERLLREARNLDGSRRFYPPGLHRATHRYREQWERLSLLPESPERDEAMQHIERELAKFEKGEDEAKRQYLRAHGIES